MQANECLSLILTKTRYYGLIQKSEKNASGSAVKAQEPQSDEEMKDGEEGDDDELDQAQQTPVPLQDKNMQMECQLLLKRSQRCEHFDYSSLRKAFPEDQSPIVIETIDEP